MCVLISSTTFFILGRIERHVIKMSSALYVKYLLFLSDLKETWTFMTVFQKILEYQIHKNLFSGSRVVPCGRTNGWTDTKLIVAFSNFVNEPKNNSLHIRYVIWEQEAVLLENIDSNF